MNKNEFLPFMAHVIKGKLEDNEFYYGGSFWDDVIKKHTGIDIPSIAEGKSSS